MTDKTTPLPLSFDKDEAALEKIAIPAGRLEYHRKRLWFIKKTFGDNGVAAYKARFPEATRLRVHGNATVSEPVPAGHDESLCKMVDTWFISDLALAESNRASVERLNLAMAPRRFDPDRYFSKKLSAHRLKKLAAVFEARGAYLDMEAADTMSKVRAAVRAARASSDPSARPFGKVGTRSGNVLTIGHRAHRIGLHKGKECIRVTAEGVTQRFYLAPLLALLESIHEDDPLSTLRTEGMGELVPGSKSGELGESQSGTGTSSHEEGLPTGNGLAERIAQVKAAACGKGIGLPTPYSDDPDADPLASHQLD